MIPLPSEGKIVELLLATLFGAVLTKFVPFLWDGVTRAWKWVTKRLGGWIGYSSFKRAYLDSVITEHGNLNLTGILNVDASARPKLEDVFISLSVGNFGSNVDFLHAEMEARITELVKEIESRDQQMARRLRRTLQIPGQGRLGQVKSALNLLQRDDVVLLKQEQDLITKISETYNYLRARPDLSAAEALRQYSLLAILGAPGAGKTTLLQWVAVSYARHEAGDRLLRQRNLYQQRLGIKEWKFPIMVRLSSLAPFLASKTADGRDPTVVEVLPKLLLPHLQEYRDAQQYFARELNKGRCVVLLDGLDEVPGDAEFKTVARGVKSLIEKYPKNQFVISSRVAGWRGGIGTDFRVYQVNELSDDQINGFIDAWYAAVERNERARAPDAKSDAVRQHADIEATKKANELKRAIQENSGLRRLSVNPLLLSVVALVHRSRHVLPKERAKLYGDCSALMLLQWDAPKNPQLDRTRLSYLDKELIVRRIAYALHTGEIGSESGGREADRKIIEGLIAAMLPKFGHEPAEAGIMVEHLVTRSGLLSERRRDVLAFAHHTFQEYYTALELSGSESSVAIKFLTDDRRLDADWWREVILLYSCLIPDAKPLLTFLATPSLDNLYRTRLRLAFACLLERGSVEGPVREAILSQVDSIRSGSTEARTGTIPGPVIQYISRWSATPAWLTYSAAHSVRRANSAQNERAWSDDLAAGILSLDSDERTAALGASVLLDADSRTKSLFASIRSVAESSSAQRSAALECLWAFPEWADVSVPLLLTGMLDPDVSCAASCCRAIGRALEQETLTIPIPELEKAVPHLIAKNPVMMAPALMEWGWSRNPELLVAVIKGIFQGGYFPDPSSLVGSRSLHAVSPVLAPILANRFHHSLPKSDRVFAAALLSELMNSHEDRERISAMLAQAVDEAPSGPMTPEFPKVFVGFSQPVVQPVIDALLRRGPGFPQLQAIRVASGVEPPPPLEPFTDIVFELLFKSATDIRTALITDLRSIRPASVPPRIIHDLRLAARETSFMSGIEVEVFSALANLGRATEGEETEEILNLLLWAVSHPDRMLQCAAALAVPRLRAYVNNLSNFDHIIQDMVEAEQRRHALQWETLLGLKFRHAGLISLWLLHPETGSEKLVDGLAKHGPIPQQDFREICELIAEIECSERVLDLLISAYSTGAVNATTLSRVAAQHPMALLRKICDLLTHPEERDRTTGLKLLGNSRTLLRPLLRNQYHLANNLDSALMECLDDPIVSESAWEFYRHGV